MGLNISKGNVYEFVTHTWNTVKGACLHGCSYCYMKRFGGQKTARFDAKEMKTDLGEGNFIFVGSSNDLFAENLDMIWLTDTLEHCKKYNNKYLFQTKNPKMFLIYLEFAWLPKNSVFCVTMESNRHYPKIMANSPDLVSRAKYTELISKQIDCYVTIEPILDFDLGEFVELIKQCNPKQVNIGADSCGNNLPEPSKNKILALISELSEFTTVHEKQTLKRLMK